MDNHTWHEHSLESDWEAAAFVAHPFQRAAGELVAATNPFGGVVHASSFALQWLEVWAAGLSASRRILDHWKQTIRDQQDSYFAGVRDQLHRVQARQELTSSDAGRTNDAPPAG